MTAALIFDAILVALIIGIAVWCLATRDGLSAVIGFIALGLLLAFAWVRLWAVDVALTEVAIGSGVTGMLLLSAATRHGNRGAALEHPRLATRVAAAALSTLVAVSLLAIVLHPTTPAPTLAPYAVAGLPATGLGNPVTAVLMAFRAFDTLLEKVVLMLALVGVWSLAPDRAWAGSPTLPVVVEPASVLRFFAQIMVPVGIVVAIYSFWAGADLPGGAFQGGAILAALWLVVMMAGLATPPSIGAEGLRLVLVLGAAMFLAAGFLGSVFAGGFLAYPPGFAKALIIAIEAGMMISVAATLALLVAGPPQGSAKP